MRKLQVNQMVNLSDSSRKKTPLELLKENFGQNLESLSKREKFILLASMAQVAAMKDTNEEYSLLTAYRDLPGGNVTKKLFELMPALNETLSEENLLRLCQELIEKLSENL